MSDAHLDERTALAFVAGTLPGRSSREADAHLASCRTCRALLRKLGADHKLELLARPGQHGPNSELTELPSPSVMELVTDPGQATQTQPLDRAAVLAALDAADGESTLSEAPSDGPTDRSVPLRRLGLAEGEPEVTATPGRGTLLAGRFRLGVRLGGDGLGSLFAARDEKLGVEVAIKLLRPELTLSAAYLEQLRRELRIARKISHPNVARVYDLGESKPYHFITQEPLAGETLEEAQERQPPGPAQAADWLRQVAEGLGAAHATGIVHRDLRPANVVVRSDGRVVVTSFGLARDLSTESSLSLRPVGAPAYWSPEQETGGRISPAADVYSLGLVAYRLFAGRDLPRLEPLPQALKAVPRPVRALLRRCLQERPEERPSAEQVAAELQLALPALAAPPLRTWLLVGGTALAVALIGLALLLKLQ